MQNYDELLALREKLASGLAGKSQADYPDDFAALSQVEDKIIALKKSSLSNQLSAKRSNGLVPLPYLNTLESELTGAPKASSSKWASVLKLVQDEKSKTNAKIAELASKAAGELKVAEQIEVYNELSILSGRSEWKAKRDDLLNQLVADIRKASKEESFDPDLREKLAVIKLLRGDDKTLVDEMIGVDAKIYEKQFFSALGEGKADDAYKTLVQMSEAKDFELIKGKLAPTSQKMGDLFTALANDSVKDAGNLSQSYRWYNQAKGVRSILGLPAAQASTYEALGDQLKLRANELSKDEAAASLAYLYAIKTFQPTRPGLRKQLVDTENAVTDLAVKRLSTTDFQSSYKDQDYGDVISSFVTQYLFKHVPHDVRIVEREQYEAILRERELSGNTGTLSSVNLLVSGSVLESKVDSSEAKNKKMMRVEVGTESKPNPNYIKWLELPSKERKNVEKPSETLELPKFENISVGVTRHRKVGIFSVSYRLVQASTGRVLFPDSITVNSEHEDETREGVEMGDFVVDAKLAELPSDVEILDDLARKVATEIGEKLVSELKDQERKYLAKADQYKRQNDCVGRVTALGNAMMIMKLKGQDVAGLLPEYRDSSVACFN
jgi:curli biogenesis system outer membrane secretion channel CsgG